VYDKFAKEVTILSKSARGDRQDHNNANNVVLKIACGRQRINVLRSTALAVIRSDHGNQKRT
jgi:hypothetical protein